MSAPPNTCGININGFKIIGAPNKIGSLIPNKAGNSETFPIFRYRYDLETMQATMQPIEIPQPVKPKKALDVPAV